MASVSENKRLSESTVQCDVPAKKLHSEEILIQSASTFNAERSIRRVQLKAKQRKDIDNHMKELQKRFINQKWPNEKKGDKPIKCAKDCLCSSYAQCYQNAQAYCAAYDYLNQYPDTFVATNLPKLNKCVSNRCHKNVQINGNPVKCASKLANHHIPYYDSGQIGENKCHICGALLLRNERCLFCANGETHTEEMISEYKELQNPPNEYLVQLVQAKDKKRRENFLNNTLTLNNSFSFASTYSEKAPEDQLGGRKDTCKYNGLFSHQFYDLKAPKGKSPLFAQVYLYDPKEAAKIRKENITSSLGTKIQAEIFEILEHLIRQNPYGKTFSTARDIIEESKKKNETIEEFQIILLTQQELMEDAIKNRQDCKVIERVDAPTAKNVAVIWVSEDGIAPRLSGFWLSDKFGNKQVITNGMSILDPTAFPLLAMRGTPGFRRGLKKRSYQNDRLNKGIDQMEEDLEEALIANFEETQSINNNQENEVEEDGQEWDDEDANIDENNADVEYVDDNPFEEFPEIPDEILNAAFKQFMPSQPERIIKKRTDITERPFYKYRFAIRDPGKNTFHWLWFFRKLAEFFVISVTNRIERNELEYVKRLQDKRNMRSILAKEYIYAIEKGLQKEHPGSKLGRVYLMPSTFPGSRQNYQQHYADLMTMVRAIGGPTWFITFTGNSKWPELVAAIQEDQEYTHRPDIVCRFFMEKATEFICDLTKRDILGNVEGWCYSVEHQKRGMPHIHILLILSKDSKIQFPEQVDQYVSARLPPLPPMDDMSLEAHQQRRLWYLVTTMMLHDCNAACTGINGKCKKAFPKCFSEETVLSDDRYAEYERKMPSIEDENNFQDELDPDGDPENDIQYARILPPTGQLKNYNEEGLIFNLKKRNAILKMDDRHVISYNPFLLLKYGSHINVEYVYGQKACKYLFKYVLKGFEKGYVKVTQPSARKLGNVDYDEITATFKVRYMTAAEAYLWIFAFPIVKQSHTIYKLPVHDEAGHTIVIEEGHEEENMEKAMKHSKLTAFFHLCNSGDPIAQSLTYDQIPLNYTWNAEHRKWNLRTKERQNGLVRIYTVSPTRTELFAIRCLLIHKKGPKSFMDLRTVGGVTYSTFTEAAQKSGLLESDDIYKSALEDACNQLKPDISLRHYLAMLILHCQPQDPQKLFEEFLEKIYPAPIIRNKNDRPLSEKYRRINVLQTLEYFFRKNGTSCKEQGLIGLPDDFDFEEFADDFENELLQSEFFNSPNENGNFQKYALNQVKSLKDDQKKAFDEISKVLQKEVGGLFFVEGSGGCGKTYLYNTLIRWCMAGMPSQNHTLNTNKALQPKNVISAATTGIASLLLIGGSTIHRKFFVPNDVDANTPPKVDAHSKMADYFRMAKLIVIDEVSMLNVDVFNYVNRLLKDLCSNDQPFGGKTLVFGGDWKQLAPVVENGGKQEQIQASIKNDELFKQFQILHLNQNKRLNYDEFELRKWLHEVGNGKNYGVRSDYLDIPNDMQLNSINEAIEFCFPTHLFANPLNNAQLLSEAAILCPRNVDVELINNIIMEKMIGQMHESISIDVPLQNDEISNIFRSDFNMESIHALTPTGLPPHRLRLKIGAPVMLIKNLDISQGLCNGTRLQIIKVTHTNLLCNILTGPKTGNQILIPLVKFTYGTKANYKGFKFSRLQFPIRPCFSMTVNKAQGQTLGKMALVLNGKQCFSHGQVYVALSRVKSRKGLKIVTNSYGEKKSNKIRNVVYYELLDE